MVSHSSSLRDACPHQERSCIPTSDRANTVGDWQVGNNTRTLYGVFHPSTADTPGALVWIGRHRSEFIVRFSKPTLVDELPAGVQTKQLEWILDEHEVVMFSKEKCPFCKKLSQLLVDNAIG